MLHPGVSHLPEHVFGVLVTGVFLGVRGSHCFAERGATCRTGWEQMGEGQCTLHGSGGQATRQET